MVEGGDAAGQFTQRHRGWLLAEGRLARELSERSEVDTGKCWATRTCLRRFRNNPTGKYCPIFFAHGLLRVYSSYKHPCFQRNRRREGTHCLLSPENSLSPLQKPGLWAVSDKSRSKEFKRQREF